MVTYQLIRYLTCVYESTSTRYSLRSFFRSMYRWEFKVTKFLPKGLFEGLR